MFLKKYIFYIISIIIIVFLTYRLFFSESDSTKLLKQELKDSKVLIDSLSINISKYGDTVKIYKRKNKIVQRENNKLKLKLYKKEVDINNEIINNEKKITSIDSVDNEYADDYISNYKYIPYTEERSH